MESLDKLNEKKLNLNVSIPVCIEIAYRSMKGDIISLDDVACNYFNGRVDEALRLVTNPVFNQMVHHLSVANAKLGFDAIAFNKLLQIARFSMDEKNQINAIKTLGDMIGVNESKKQQNKKTEININLDTIVRQQSDSPFKGF